MKISDDTFEPCYDAFRDGYHSSFPRGGDEGDHDEAIREGLYCALVAFASRLGGVKWDKPT